MAKLSQQIPQKTPYYTRTERLKVRQAQRREGIDQQQFEELQKKAEQLQRTEFANITSVEEYSEKYNRLSPALRQFFVAPAQLQEQQSATISTTKTNLQKEIAEAQKKKSEVLSNYQKKIEEAKADWNIQSASHRQDPRNRERYQAKIERLNNAIEEKEVFYDEYVRRLNEGYNEVSAGKNLSYSSVVEYATEYGSYKEDQKRARNEQTAFAQKQLKKVEELQSQGYTPFVIEQKSAIGKTEKVSVELYSAEKGDYQTIYTYKPTQDVSKLQKSKIEKATIPLVFDIGKQKVTYSATTELYKDQTGKLFTPYGAIGITEAEVIKQSQDAYKIQRPEGIEMPETKKTFWEKAGEKVVLPFVEKLTPKQKAVASGVYKPMESIKEFYDKIPSKPFDVPIFIGAGGTMEVKPFVETGISGLGKAKESVIGWVLGEEKIEQLPEQESLQAISVEYQQRFEDQYMKQFIAGEIDFETASKEFEESEIGKQMQKKYETVYLQEYAKLRAETPKSLKKTAGTIAIGGLGFGQTLLGFTPETRKGALVTGVALTTGISAIKLIPPKYIYGALTVNAVTGAIRWSDPTKTIEEAGAGAFTTVLSASFLGYGAYKYFRSPVTTRVKIKPPKASLKTEAIGQEAMKYNIRYENQIRQLEKLTFGKQKLSQQAIAGYRTVISTKGRVLLNKYLNYQMTGVKVKTLYEGVPYADPKGYARAFGRLKSYGYTPAQAKATLRYSAPQIIDKRLLSGEILASPTKAKATFTYETTKPIYDVDKRLGIKTRGGRIITDVYKIDRALSQEIAVINKQVVPYDVVTQRITRIRTPAPLGKTTTKFIQKGVVDVSKVSESYLKIELKDLQRGITYTTKPPYQQQFLKEIYYQKQILPLKRRITTGTGRTTIMKSELTQEINLDKLMEQLRGFKVTKIPVTKPATPVRTIDQMSNVELKKMIKNLKDIYKPTKLQRWSAKAMKEYQQSLIAPKPEVTPTKDLKAEITRRVSEYSGKGMYERTEEFGSAQLISKSSQLNQQLISQLKSAYFPPEVTPSVKSAIIQKELIYMGTGAKVLSASALGLRERSDVKSSLALRNLLKEDFTFKLDQQLGLKGALRQDLALRQAPALQTALKLDTSLITGLSLSQLQTTYKPRPTTFPPFLFDLDLKEKLRKKRKEKKKSIWELGLLPDFTAKAIGLKSPEIAIKDIEKQLLRVQTGIDIRRGGKVKWA